MAKKKPAPSKASPKTNTKSKTGKPKAAAASTATRKPADKKSLAGAHENGHGHSHDHDHSECCEIELDKVEANAFEMVQKSKKIGEELDQAVNTSVFLAVRKFYREHGVNLSAAQAQNVGIALFGG